jgi:arabinogalactan endo-1,4-beta-galactosidase
MRGFLFLSSFKKSLNLNMIKKTYLIFGLVLLLLSCSKENQSEEPVILDDTTFIKAADISFLPLIESEGTLFYNSNNQVENALTTLKNAGCNTIRIRLWKNPIDSQSSLAQVKTLSQRVKQAGMKVWLCVHYSDTWSDPGAQTLPAEWQSLSFTDLELAVANYTSTVLTQVQPDIIQIGNEINTGFMWPSGNLISNESQFLQLLSSASSIIRTQSPTTKIMLHYAGIGADASWFFNKVSSINYDYIGLSYYPIWHGKNLNDLKTTITTLGQTHNKKVIIAETSYPFTLNWNDWTNNVLGSADQIIPSFPATPEGQKDYMLALKSTIQQTQMGAGFCYWGTEWIAFRGTESTNGSSWENQAMWDFNRKVLPVIQVFN